MIKYEDVPDGLDNIPFPAITFNNELQFQQKYVRITDIFVWRTPPFEEIVEMLEGDKFVA
jgi:hypothetical protein